MAIHKRLIFTVTAGRTGTAYLARLFEAVPGVSAHHEPFPQFVDIMRPAQSEPDLALAFLRDIKLPEIAKAGGEVYIETSHLVCKGFIEALILEGLRPGLILLRRPPREIAWSYLERGAIPGRTVEGTNYLLKPSDPYVLPLLEWEKASNYQLCFWYALEMECRQRRYAALAKTLSLPVVDVTNRELNDWAVFKGMLAEFGGLPATEVVRQAHAKLSAEQHNANRSRLPLPDGLDDAEAAIWQRVRYFEPLLEQQIATRYAKR